MDEDTSGAEFKARPDLLKDNVPCAHKALKKLPVDRVMFTPIRAENGRQTYAFAEELSYGALLRGIIEYLGSDPLGIRSKYLALRHLDLTIPFSGRVAA